MSDWSQTAELLQGYEQLTPREREVMRLVGWTA